MSLSGVVLPRLPLKLGNLEINLLLFRVNLKMCE